jgi:hypothetical protein
VSAPRPTKAAALADLSGQWIDLVHAPLVLDTDSSVSPTHREQELERLERPLRMHLLMWRLGSHSTG